MGRRGAARAALALAIIVGGAACTGGGATTETESPGSSGSLSSAPSPSPSPSPSETVTSAAPEPPGPEPMELPSPPAALQTDDEAGVRAVTQYVLDLYVYMYRTGDTAPFAAISSDVCTFCSASVKEAQALWAEGGYMTGGALSMSADATVSLIGDTGVFQVEGDLTREAAHWVRGDGRVVEEPAQVIPGAKAGVTVFDGVWTFVELENPAK